MPKNNSLVVKQTLGGFLRRALPLILGIMFAFVINKAPLYTSNENTKLLHGVARAEPALLGKDWLAQTSDPLPVFSKFVEYSYNVFGADIFYLYYFVLITFFLIALLKQFSPDFFCQANKYPNEAAGVKARARSWLFIATLFVIYSKWMPNALRDGVAKQYLIDPLFQNSLFGIFLILAIPLFLNNRRALAGLCIVIAYAFHSTYILSALALVLAFMFIMLREGKPVKNILFFGISTMTFAVLLTLYLRQTLVGSSPEIHQQALNILANKRIPHHSLPALWLDINFFIKAAIALFAIKFCKELRIRIILLTMIAIATTGTVLQIVTHSNLIALIAPWRISVFIIPLSVCVIAVELLERLLTKFKSPKDHQRLLYLAIALVITTGSIGIYKNIQWVARVSHSDETELLNFVSEHKLPNDLTLIPIKDYRLDAFRLTTLSPIFINFKSHPYNDMEVVEWDKRCELADLFYRSVNDQDIIFSLKRLVGEYGISKIVLPTQATSHKVLLERLGLTKLFENKKYSFYGIPINFETKTQTQVGP